MEPFTDTGSLPLAIAQVDSAVDLKPEVAAALPGRTAADVPVDLPATPTGH
jgi:hypothetical protein